MLRAITEENKVKSMEKSKYEKPTAEVVNAEREDLILVSIVAGLNHGDSKDFGSQSNSGWWSGL